jgi:hypothetical protein
MTFAIKLTECDLWVGNKHISYFVRDDSYFNFVKQNIKYDTVSCFGVTPERKRVFLSTDNIRCSLKCYNKETVIKYVVLPPFGINYEVMSIGSSLGKFSKYVVVDLTSGNEYPLDDVLNGLV